MKLEQNEEKPEPTNDSDHAEDAFFHHEPESFSDRVALYFVKFLRFFADAFFAKRYGNRAVVLETVAAVPGMVGGAILHLRSVRRMKQDEGWIHTLLEEAENERMHLMTFVEIAQPTKFERALVMFAQVFFYFSFFLLYLISSKLAHRIVGYLEEEAVVSYTEYANMIDSGKVDNVKAPQIAIDYWGLSKDATLRDVVRVIRADEMMHREVNHLIADKQSGRKANIRIFDEMSEAAVENLSTYAKRNFPK
jgi:ubiquinol oxidase